MLAGQGGGSCGVTAWRTRRRRSGNFCAIPTSVQDEAEARQISGLWLGGREAHIGQRLEGDKGARLVRFIGYKAGDRTASCRFSWNSDNAWLWRHKLAAFAKRYGAKDTDDLRRIFGRRWAYQRCAEILAEPLDGVVFPSKLTMLRSCDLQLPVILVRHDAEIILEQLPATRTVLVGDESLNDWPVWAVPAWFGEKVASTPLTPEILRQGEERARELRLYAARLEVLISTPFVIRLTLH